MFGRRITNLNPNTCSICVVWLFYYQSVYGQFRVLFQVIPCLGGLLMAHFKFSKPCAYICAQQSLLNAPDLCQRLNLHIEELKHCPLRIDSRLRERNNKRGTKPFYGGYPI